MEFQNCPRLIEDVSEYNTLIPFHFAVLLGCKKVWHMFLKVADAQENMYWAMTKKQDKRTPIDIAALVEEWDSVKTLFLWAYEQTQKFHYASVCIILCSMYNM